MNNNKKGSSPARKGSRISKKLFNLLVIVTVIILVSLSGGIWYTSDLVYGYKYYDSNLPTTTIAVSQQDDLVYTTIEEYLAELQEQGYYVANYSLDAQILCSVNVIHKRQINDEEFIDKIKDCLNIEILITQLTLDGDDTIYYFKTDDECQTFLRKLNNYIEQTYTIESIVDDYELITSQNILDQKINSVMEQKKAEEAAAAAVQNTVQTKTVTSRSGSSTRTTTASNGCFPLASYTYISSKYGMRNGKMHTGVDFAAPVNTSVYAWKSGTVTTASWNGGYGNFIEIQHDDGTISRYAHLNGYAVAAGDSVQQGQTIGYVGTSGNSTGYHLHFEIKINNDFVNPLNYL